MKAIEFLTKAREQIAVQSFVPQGTYKSTDDAGRRCFCSVGAMIEVATNDHEYSRYFTSRLDRLKNDREWTRATKQLAEEALKLAPGLKEGNRSIYEDVDVVMVVNDKHQELILPMFDAAIEALNKQA